MRKALAALLLGALVLSGCHDDPGPPTSADDPDPTVEPSVTAADASDTYGPLVRAVVDAVAAASVPGRSDGDPESVYVDDEIDSCVYASTRYEFGTVFGEEVSWDDVRETVGQVLGPEGFELTEQLDIPGGFNGFDATTDDGAVLEVRSKLGQPSIISLDAPVSGACGS